MAFNYRTPKYSFFFDVDANERILSFKCKPESSDLSDLILGKTVSEVLSVETCFNDLKLIEQFLNIKSALIAHLRPVVGSYFVNLNSTDELVCRCTGKTYKDILDVLETNPYEAKEVYRQLNVCAFCGTCSNEVRVIIDEYQSQLSIIDGRSSEQWESIIAEQINDFYLVAPDSVADIQLQFLKIDKKFLRLRCYKKEGSLKRLEIQGILEQYFKDILPVGVELKIIT